MAKSRLPHLAAGRVEQYGGDHPHACVDIVVEGTLERGLTSVQVEFEDLADLLSDLGGTDDAAAIVQAIGDGDAATALPATAAVMQRMYSTNQPRTD